MQDKSAIRSITALCEYLSTEGQGTEVSLQNVTITSRTTGDHGSVNDPRSACWRSLAVKPQRAEVSERNIGHGLFRLGHFNEKDIIHGVISGAGTKLQAGKLFLGARGCVVFDDTCEEVLLSDVGITGSMPLSRRIVCEFQERSHLSVPGTEPCCSITLLRVADYQTQVIFESKQICRWLRRVLWARL